MLYFPEIAALVGECRFNDCTHTQEPGCAVIQAVEEVKSKRGADIELIDLLTIAPMDIQHTVVRATMVGGKFVYQGQDFAIAD